MQQFIPKPFVYSILSGFCSFLGFFFVVLLYCHRHCSFVSVFALLDKLIDPTLGLESPFRKKDKILFPIMYLEYFWVHLFWSNESRKCNSIDAERSAFWWGGEGMKKEKWIDRSKNGFYLGFWFGTFLGCLRKQQQFFLLLLWKEEDSSQMV